MGFNEDDRIRAKNRVINCAYEIYDNLYALGYSAADIKAHAQLKMSTDVDPRRNEIYLAVINIADVPGRTHGSSESTKDSKGQETV